MPIEHLSHYNQSKSPQNQKFLGAFFQKGANSKRISPSKPQKLYSEVIFTEPKNKKNQRPKSPENSKLPPAEYDGAAEESGVILTPAEAIDLAQGLDN